MLIDCFDETGIDLAFLTETWLKDSTEHRDMLKDLADGHNLSVIARNRKATVSGRAYGGVAVVSRNSTCTLKEFELVNPNNYEVVAAVGKIRGVKGRVF